MIDCPKNFCLAMFRVAASQVAIGLNDVAV